MGRIFILVTCFTIQLNYLFSQNLLLNGDFEEINHSDKSNKFYLNNFYFKYWIEPTDCSSDVYRDFNACNRNFIKNIEPGLDFCVKTVSGNYCAGIYLLDAYGYMEHITGKLTKPLEREYIYRVSFYMKYFGDEKIASTGFGYKFSQDSIVFKSNILFEKKLSPFYYELFDKQKIFSDFEFDTFIIDTNWIKYETYYVGKGNESYITFGKFSYKNDNQIIKQMKDLSRNKSVDYVNELIANGKLKYLNVLGYSSNQLQAKGLTLNYYLIDNVKVEKLSDEVQLIAKRTCLNCIDNDPLTIYIPNKLEFNVDKGYFGELEFNIFAKLKENEALFIDLDKDNKIIVVNADENKTEELKYMFKYPAKKLKKKPIKYYIGNNHEIIRLNNKYKKYVFNMPAFKGTIYSNLKNYIQ